jgi:hypothetical protein
MTERSIEAEETTEATRSTEPEASTATEPSAAAAPPSAGEPSTAEAFAEAPSPAPAAPGQVAGSIEAETSSFPPDAVDWPRCPWCSSPTPPGSEKCPTCQAALVAYPDAQAVGIPGVTEIDPSLLAYAPKAQKPQKIVDMLISLLDEDEVARAARERLAKPKKDGQGDAAAQPNAGADETARR